MIASQKGYRNLVHLLLKSGARPNIRVQDSNIDKDKTAIIFAIQNEYIDILEILLDYNANVDISFNENGKEESVLTYSVYSKNKNMLKLILKHFKDNSENKKDITVLELLNSDKMSEELVPMLIILIKSRKFNLNQKNIIELLIETDYVDILNSIIELDVNSFKEIVDFNRLMYLLDRIEFKCSRFLINKWLNEMLNYYSSLSIDIINFDLSDIISSKKLANYIVPVETRMRNPLDKIFTNLRKEYQIRLQQKVNLNWRIALEDRNSEIVL